MIPPREKHLYLVGWNCFDPRIVYGKDRKDGAGWVDALTLTSARRQARKLYPSKKLKRAIYKLVLVEEVE